MAVLALACAVGGLPPVAATATPAPVRILIVGDSVAQGSSGDWTWRYRLWQELQRDGVDVDFVGPRSDLVDIVTSELGSQAYADPDFDHDHAARWGMAMWLPDVSMTDLVTEYDPDVVVEARGFNDLAYKLNADGLTEVLTDEIAEARAVDPGIDFVVEQLPQTWINHVPDYNAGLPGVAATLDDEDSRVVVAETGDGFTEFTDTWDSAHLAATGEVKVASGVADALAELGIGDGAGTPPVVRNGHWGSATLAVASADRSAELSWAGPPGAAAEYVWLRNVTAGDDWVRLPYPVVGTSWVAGGLVAGHRYAFRLQAVKGTAVADDYSNVVEVVPTAPPEPAAPPAGPPAPVVATPGPQQLTVEWPDVARATSYDVTWTSDVPGEDGTMNVASGPVVLGGLAAGRAYRISVVARNAAGVSAAAVGRGVPAPPSMSGRPTGLVVTPGSHRLNVTWTPVPGATAYDVSWTGRRLGMHGATTVERPSVAITYVLAGESYDITVTARNADGPGLAATTVGVPQGPRVLAPARLRAVQIAPHRAQLTWRHRSAASSYDVQVRRAGRWTPVRNVVALTTTVGRLPRGAASFRVRSWHQLVPGPWSPAVRVRMR
ncbi:hypothetical protein ASC77_02940 [Nocardioides sp. Root1257]|nr:hypothetical protein ASC77_02940 [Nocardioides sp. Root1257]KRC55948.1 hypothetical protein ASE24_02940 [Nocardioides sp. Root224]